MSHIPNKAMPHAKAGGPEARAPAWQGQLDMVRGKARDLFEMARARPLEIGGAGAVLLLSLATAGWARRRSRRHAFG